MSRLTPEQAAELNRKCGGWLTDEQAQAEDATLARQAEQVAAFHQSNEAWLALSVMGDQLTNQYSRMRGIGPGWGAYRDTSWLFRDWQWASCGSIAHQGMIYTRLVWGLIAAANAGVKWAQREVAVNWQQWPLDVLNDYCEVERTTLVRLLKRCAQADG